MSIIFENVCECDNSIYFFCRNYNAIYRISDGSLEYVTSVSEYGFFVKRLFGPVCRVEKLLVFAPLSADSILVFDTSTKKYELYPIKMDEKEANAKSKYHIIKSHGDEVFIFGGECKSIVKFNPYSGEQEIFTDWFNESEILFDREHNIVFLQDICIDGENLIVPCCYDNKIVEFDINTNEVRVITVPAYKEGFSGICYDGEVYWLSPMKGNYLTRWNKGKEEYEFIELPPHSGINGVQYGGIFMLGNHIIAQQSGTGTFVAMDLTTRKFQTLIMADNKDYHCEEYRPFFVDKDRTSIFLCHSRNGDMFDITFDSCFAIKKIGYKEDERGMNAIVMQASKDDNVDIIAEGDEFMLNGFINMICLR